MHKLAISLPWAFSEIKESQILTPNGILLKLHHLEFEVKGVRSLVIIC